MRLLLRGIAAVWGGAIAFFLLAILLGAPLTRQFYETLVWSTLQACFTVLPVFLLHGVNLKDLWRIFVAGVVESKTERVIRTCGVWSMIGTMVGVSAFPLDWDEPWQEYPLPIVVMCTVGFFVGAAFSLAS